MFTTEAACIVFEAFSSNHEANEFLHNAEQLIKVYGYVSLADMLDLCGEHTAYTDAKIGWTEAAFKNAKIKKIREGYAISMPKYDWYKNYGFDTADKQLQSEPEPINITIPAEKPEVIRETINSLCDNLEKIKDHSVFITIM